ncbi:MAG TPA: hypothetical protein VNP73_05840 [Actinomycetota bacterium]|nr:hypothetical protein [Actinomycetota bacterium]
MKGHQFDPVSFLFGLLFAGLGLVFLFGDFTLLDLGWRWIWPVPVIFTGVLVLSLALNRYFKQTQDDQSESSESLSSVVR